MSGQHSIVITAIDAFGIAAHLDCEDHDSETCHLQEWWGNCAVGELCDLKPLDIALPVHAEPWGEDDGPTIELAEMPAPITWDGNDEAYDAIEELLRPLGVTILLDDIDAYELDEPMPALQLRNIFSTFPTVGFIPPMARIRREGDSFVILPPEVKP